MAICFFLFHSIKDTGGSIVCHFWFGAFVPQTNVSIYFPLIYVCRCFSLSLSLYPKRQFGVTKFWYLFVENVCALGDKCKINCGTSPPFICPPFYVSTSSFNFEFCLENSHTTNTVDWNRYLSIYLIQYRPSACALSLIPRTSKNNF